MTLQDFPLLDEHVVTEYIPLLYVIEFRANPQTEHACSNSGKTPF